MSWSDFSASPEFQNLSPEARNQARLQYFQQRIAPKVPEERRDSYLRSFLRDTQQDVSPQIAYRSTPQTAEELADDQPGFIGDSVRSVGAGLIGIGEGVARGVEQITGAPNTVSDFIGRGTDALREGRSDATKDAVNNFSIAGDGEFSVRGLTQLAMEGGGSMAGFLIPGGVLAQGARLGLRAAGAAPKVAQTAGSVIGFGTVAGPVGGSSTMEEVTNEVMQADFNDLAQAPGFKEEYRRAYEANPEGDHAELLEQAREQLSLRMGDEAFTGGAVRAAVIEGLLGPVYDKIIRGTGGVVKSIARGSATEAAQEASDAAVGTAQVNNALTDIDGRAVSQDVLSNAIDSGAVAALSGGAVGGATGGANRLMRNEDESIDPEVAQMLDEALARVNAGEGTPQDQQLLLEHDGTIYSGYGDPEAQANARATTEQAMTGQFGQARNTGLEGEVIPGQPMQPPAAAPGVIEGEGDEQGRLAGANDLGLPQPDGVVYGQEPDWMVQQRQDSADRLARAREVTASALTDQFTPSPMAEAVAQPEQPPRMLGLPDMGMTPAPDSMMMADPEGRTTDPVLGDGRDGFTSQSSTQPGMNVPVPKQSTAQLLSDLADAVARVDQMRAEGIRPKVVGERGSQSRVKLGENYEDVDFMLVDLAKNPAMRPDFNVGENQNRDRTRAAYTQQVSRIAQGLDFNELGSSARMSEGAPTVTPEGVIIGGNGRIAAILEAYKKGTADNYRQELETRAAEFGIKPNKIKDMQQPALVRRFVNPVDVAMATQRSNEQTGADMSALEQARIDGDRLADIPDLNVDAGGNFNTPANSDFIRQFVKSLPTNEQNAVATRDGKLSQSGVTRLRNALLYKAYGDTEVLAELVEATDSGRRNILAALTEAAPKVAQVRAAIDRGELHDADISAEIVEAVGVINDLAGRDLDMAEYLAQGDMLGGITDLAKDIAQVFDARKRSAKGIRDFIVAYYDGVIALGSPDQQGLFGNATISVPDLINRAADSIGVSIDGQSSQENQTRQPESEDGADGADQEGADSEGSGTDEGFSLSTQTEEDLAQQEAERTAAAEAEAKSAKEAEQKAAADREADDFVLSGSNRTADVATARGQNDLFGAGQSKVDIDTAANEAATSPTNDLAEPSDAQKDAGNYKKGRIRFQGLDIAIENPKGSTRSGTDPDGNEWSSTMAHHYGDIKGTTAADGDNLDVFIGPNEASDLVFIIDQVNADGSFDEHKIMLGFENQKAARDGYRANYDAGWKVGPTTRMTMEQFKEWLKGDTTKPVSDKVKAAQAEPEQESGRSEPLEQVESGQSEPAEQFDTPEPIAFDLSKPAHEVTTDLRRALNGGEAVPIKQVKAVFERVVADPEATKADLNKLKKADLVKFQTGFARSDVKKADMVEMAYDGLISRFRFIGNNSSFISTSMGEDRVKLARDHLNTLDDDAVAQYARDQKAATDDRIAEIKAFRESLDNPQTLEDFREVVRIKGATSLTDEQRARYDALIAENEQAAKPSIREGLQSEDEIELGEPVEGVHGKTGETIFNVKVITRLGKDKFKEAAGFARTLKGGYYRGNFYFKSIEDAELFSAWVNGRDVDTTEQVQARAEQRQSNAKDRLKEMADRIEQRANQSLNADRKENTANRMREADGARADAEKDLRRANLLRAIADSDAKFIKGATQKVQIDLLDRMVRQLRRDAPSELTRTTADGDREWLPGVANETKVKTATMPLTDMYASTANDLANKMQDIKGMKLASRRLLNGTKGVEGNKKISVQGDTLTKLVDYAENHAEKYEYIKDLAADYKRLQRMSITSRPTLRAALLEFMEISQNVDSGIPTQNRLQTLERDLQRTMVGNRSAFNEFFPTPEATAREVVDMAGIESGMTVLEPSAGNGALADIAKESGAQVDVVEMGGDLREILQEKGHNLVGFDFLEYQPDQQYDRIVMNPPFSKDQDIQHVSHAYNMLKPGGRMVAITSSMAGDRQNNRNQQFRAFLDAVSAEEQALPEGAFKSSMNPTGVNTKAIVIDKPETDAPDAPMFSRAASKPKGMAAADIQSAVDAMPSRIKSMITVVQSIADLPAQYQKKVDPTVRGFFAPKTGKVYIVADGLSSLKEAEGVIVHEVVGHAGLRGLMAKQLHPLLATLYRNGHITDAMLQPILARYKLDMANPKQRMEALEEYIAHAAQFSEPPAFMERVRAAVRRILRSMGMVSDWTDADIAALIANHKNSSVDAVLDASRVALSRVTGTNADGSLRFSRGDTKSDAFARWFGDSKVVDENGDPMVVYHGTRSEFNEFEATHPRGAIGNPKGIYFDSDKEVAEEYAANDDGELDEKSRVIAAYVRVTGDGDGVIKKRIERGKDQIEVVAFQPDQIKSATDNNGEFNPEDPDIRMSRAQSAPGDINFGMPDETLATVAMRKMADKFKVLKDLQRNILGAGGTIDPEADAYRYEELFHGKAEDDMRRMREGFVEPLAKKMAKFDIEQSDLDQYLYARHARERNEHIAGINPDMPDGGSGMTNAEADAILARVAASGKQNEYDQLAMIIYDMLATRRNIIRENGLEGDDMIDAWESKYQHYVPLKGYAENEMQEGRPKSGRGFTIAGKESKRAMGRGSQAASPSSYAVNDLTETIIRRRKNEVGNAFLRLVEANPNKKYWQVFSDDNPEMDRRIVKRRDPETGEQSEVVEERPIPMAMMSDRYFQTKRDGKTFYIKMEDQRLMEAMKNIGPDTSNFVIQTLASITRVLSSLNTSYNPEFVVGNFARDVQTAVLNLTAEQTRDDGKARGEAIAKKTVKDIPKAMKAIYRSLRGKEQNSEWMRWFDEFRREGAKTGYFDMKDIDGQAADIERLVTMAKGGVKGNALKWASASSQLVEDLNNTVENAVRLAAYVNARKAGISAPQAASLAKNMTVNFNRRGQMGTTLNALYMFANASIQGSMNFARTMGGLKGEKGDPVWSRLNTAQKIAVGLVAGSYAMATANRLGAGEDDDGENWYDKVPDYVKERNLVLMKSLFGGEQDGSYWTIPLPYGYNIFHVLGSNVEAMTGGNRSIGEAATDMTLATLGSFSPIGFNDSQSGIGLVLKNITPTLGKPLVDVAMNENFFGSSIYNENMPFGTPQPDSSLSRRSTPFAYKAIAEFLNDVSGGSQWRSGAIDVNPDVMRYFVDYYLGAAGNFALNKLPDNAFNLANGIDMKPNQVLFLSRVRGQVQPYADRDRFYERRDEINQIMEEAKGREGRERLEFLNANRPKLALRGLISSTEERLKRLRKQRDRIYMLDLSPAELDERLEVIEIKQKQAIDRFNKAYREATSGQ